MLNGREDVLGDTIRSLDSEDPLIHLWNEYGKDEYRPLQINARSTASNWLRKAKAMNLELWCDDGLGGQKRTEIGEEFFQLMNSSFNSNDNDKIAQHLYAWRDLYQKCKIPLMRTMTDWLENRISFESAVCGIFFVKIKGGYYPVRRTISALKSNVQDYCIDRVEQMRILYG